MDEVVITISGVKRWLWRAVDQTRRVLDILVQSRRDTRAAKRLMRKLLKRQCRAPRVARQSKPRCQRQSATQSLVALRWAGSATVKTVAAEGGGLKGQALRASAQPRHWEADAT